MEKGNQREAKVRKAIKTKTGVELPSREQIAEEGTVAAAGVIGGLAGPVTGVGAAVGARVAVKGVKKIKLSKESQAKMGEAMDEIAQAASEEAAGAITGTVASTAAAIVEQATGLPSGTTSFVVNTGIAIASGTKGSEAGGKVYKKIRNRNKKDDSISHHNQRIVENIRKAGNKCSSWYR